MNLAFEIKNILRVKVGYFKKSQHNLCQNANFENGGTTIQMGIQPVCTVEHFVNILTV